MKPPPDERITALPPHCLNIEHVRSIERCAGRVGEPAFNVDVFDDEAASRTERCLGPCQASLRLLQMRENEACVDQVDAVDRPSVSEPLPASKRAEFDVGAAHKEFLRAPVEKVLGLV
jgi:hypothetical protein